ncbi:MULTISPECIES: VirK/YbjX family protein [unclassified Gilliamella]|uniref:VirK/YbjX family protein n=1 Tax=unclassified Gilliamella TaxID=2685620 RepID=UPI00226A2F4F|nr:MULTISPECIES: DUF535 family protein [unclassified Gilliamella]MCX8642606.1 DUF535 family protein [Gilliamella sp. B3835]MCX8706460.1 DUF535 family protein [Gilliamella sp. B3783]MCX8709197.1 DUF535 family protein [Gilliamella sp. B3780]MCX8712244.1 DUF535 family protein [Gilliamella sp. B3468]MCX8714569.1 DUF535 family protein [Gilliamella sp. B3781]
MKSRLTLFYIKATLNRSNYSDFKKKCTSSVYPLAYQKWENPYPFSEKIFHKYLSEKISYNKKLAILNSHIDFIDQKINPRVIDKLYSKKLDGIMLAQVEGKNDAKISFHLTAPLYPREGDLRIIMRFGEQLVFSIHFTITLLNEIYIAGVQGHTSNEILKQLTKDFFGFRPKNLIMVFMMEIAKFFKIENIYAVKSKGHVKFGKFDFDYDKFWQELNGVSYNKAWFKLPCNQPQKSIEDVKSNKRSEFKKRELIRESISEQCQKNLLAIVNPQ